MKPTLWRALILPLIAVAALFVAFGPAVQIQRDNFGLNYPPSPAETVTVQSIDPGSPAAQAGLKKGDRITFVLHGFRDRIAAAFPVSGTHLTLLVNGKRNVTLTAGPEKRVPLDANVEFTLVRLAFLLIAALLAWRRPEDRTGRALVAFLFSLGFGIALNNHAFGSPIVSFVVLQLLSTSLIIYALGAGVRFVSIFPSGDAAKTPRILAACATVVAWTGITIFILANLLRVSRFGYAAAMTELMYAVLLVLMMLLAATLVERYVHSPPAERKRRLWIFLILALGLLGPTIDITVQSVIGFNQDVDKFASLSLIIIPIGMAYVILRHRVIDVGFVLNRAAVYGLVSIVIVGVFVVLETLLAKYVETTSHVTSTALQLAVALALGFSIRAIHARADRFVDTALFRARHEAEAAIRTFAHDAPYITDADVLGERCVQTAMRYGDACGAGIWLRQASGAFAPVEETFGAAEPVSENDPAIVTMRARRVIVEVARAGSSLPGLLALPMIVRGELIGTLVVGPKKTEEAYAPDEVAALEAMTSAVGHAYDALEVRELRRRLQASEACAFATGGALGLS